MKLSELAALIPIGQTILLKEHKFTKEYDENGIAYEEKKEIMFGDRECLSYDRNKYLLNKEVAYVISGYNYDSCFNITEDFIIIEVE